MSRVCPLGSVAGCDDGGSASTLFLRVLGQLLSTSQGFQGKKAWIVAAHSVRCSSAMARSMLMDDQHLKPWCFSPLNLLTRARSDAKPGGGVVILYTPGARRQREARIGDP